MANNTSTIADEQTKMLFNGFAFLMLASIFIAILAEAYYIMLAPAALLFVYVALVDFRKIYYFLFFCIPISVEIELPGGLGTDLPTEPIMIGLMGLYLVYVLHNAKNISSNFLKHPLTVLLLLHVAWIFFTSLTSAQFIVSLKFFLAKIWYIVAFFFITGFFLKEEKHFRTFFWCVFSSLVFTVFVVMIRHSAHGFSFKEVHFVLGPFYRNHVAYASIMALFFPFLCFAHYWYERWSVKWWLIILSIPLFLVAIQLSFTRAAYVAILIAFGTYFIIQFRLTKLAVFVTIIASIVGVHYVASNNKYLDYAPNFERTVTHTKFDNLVEATYNMEDISTMERVYRWVAGGHMVNAKPWLGFGPGNFYFFYKSYTVSSFRTYVSDNPEKSGVHSYYLMTLVEQGFVGLFIFLVLCFYTIIKAETIYHETSNINRKRIIMVAVLSIVIIDSLLLINDMIETDKVGPFFFAFMAVLINMDLKNKRELNEKKKAA